MSTPKRAVRWLNVNAAANVLAISVEKVNQLVAQRGCASHFDGTNQEIAFYFNPDPDPSYILVPFAERKLLGNPSG